MQREEVETSTIITYFWCATIVCVFHNITSAVQLPCHLCAGLDVMHAEPFLPYTAVHMVDTYSKAARQASSPSSVGSLKISNIKTRFATIKIG